MQCMCIPTIIEDKAQGSEWKGLSKGYRNQIRYLRLEGLVQDLFQEDQELRYSYHLTIE